MTSNTVSGILDAILDPLVAITEQANAALNLAQRNRLPPAFIRSMRDAINRLDAAHDTLTDIAVTLDPNLAKDQH